MSIHYDPPFYNHGSKCQPHSYSTPLPPTIWNLREYRYKYRCILNLCKITSLAVTNQIAHFCKTSVCSSVVIMKMFGQVPDFHLFATKLKPKEKEN